MTGRKRKDKPRKPSGRIRDSAVEADRGLPPSIGRRLMDLGAAIGADHRFGTPLGRMLIAGEITAPLYDAGIAYAALRDAADRADGIPARSSRGIDLNRTGGRSHDDREGDGRPGRELSRVRGHLLRDEREAIEWIACDDNAPETYTQKLALRTGLERIGPIMALTGASRRANRAK